MLWLLSMTKPKIWLDGKPVVVSDVCICKVLQSVKYNAWTLM